jgi:hypothetical protein
MLLLLAYMITTESILVQAEVFKRLEVYQGIVRDVDGGLQIIYLSRRLRHQMCRLMTRAGRKRDPRMFWNQAMLELPITKLCYPRNLLTSLDCYHQTFIVA